MALVHQAQPKHHWNVLVLALSIALLVPPQLLVATPTSQKSAASFNNQRHERVQLRQDIERLRASHDLRDDEPVSRTPLPLPKLRPVEYPSEEAKVLRLNKDSLMPKIDHNYMTIVKFVVRGGEGSDMLQRMFEALAKRYNGRALFVDVTVKRESEFGILTKYTYPGTPRVVAFRQGKLQDALENRQILLEGKHAVDNFVKYAVEAHEQKLITVGKNEVVVKRFVDRYGHRPIAVGLFDKMRIFRDGFERSAITLHDEGHSRLLFLEVATEELRDLAAAPAHLPKHTFIFIREPADNTTHRIVPFKPVFDNPLELPTFLYGNAQPLITELDRNDSRYFGVKHPVFALFMEKTESPEPFRILDALARQHEGKFDFVFADFAHSKFFSALSRQNPTPHGVGFAIVGFQHGQFKKHVYGGEMNVGAVEEWIEYYFAGKLDKILESHEPKKLIDIETGEVFHHGVHSITGVW